MRNRIISVFALTVLALVMCLSTAQAASLKRGSSGDKVTQLQQKLKNWGYYSGSVDGIFGSATEAAVKKFQKKNGLTADGIVGKATAEKLGLRLSGGQSAASGDVDLIARAVYGEARGEPYEGQVAVAAVILNRVRSASFPNTVSGVIYQPGYATVLYLMPYAMAGWDPTGGCIYYYNPKTATSKWIRSAPLCAPSAIMCSAHEKLKYPL